MNKSLMTRLVFGGGLVLLVCALLVLSLVSSPLLSRQLSSPATAVAISGNGSAVAVGSAEGQVDVYPDLKAQAQPSRFSLPKGRVRSLSFSDDGSRLAAAGNAVRVWRVADGTLMKEVAGYLADLSPDGKNLAVADGVGLSLLDLERPESGSRAYVGHKETVTAVTVSSSGQVVSASQDGVVIVWSKTGKPDQELAGHDFGMRVSAIKFMRDRKRFVSGGEDGLVFLWEMKQGTTAYTPTQLGERRGPVTAVDIDEDDRVYVMVGTRFIIRTDAVSGNHVQRRSSGMYLSVSSKGDMMVIGGPGRWFYTWTSEEFFGKR